MINDHEGRPDGAGNPEAARQRALSSPEQESALTYDEGARGQGLTGAESETTRARPSPRRVITLRPSTARVWARPVSEGGCPASVTLPPASETQDTEATRRGTRLHEEMAARLSLVGRKARKEALTGAETATCDHAEMLALRVIESVFPPVLQPTTMRCIEHTLTWAAPLGDGPPHVIEGTPDLLIDGNVNEPLGESTSRRERRVLVLDYKFGDRPVEARLNRQLMLYALMHLSEEWSLRTQVTLAIVQPATTPALKAWGCYVSDLAVFASEVMTSLTSMRDGDDDVIASSFQPSESNCRWCRGRVERTCAAHKTWAARQAVDHFRSTQGDTHGDH